MRKSTILRPHLNISIKHCLSALNHSWLIRRRNSTCFAVQVPHATPASWRESDSHKTQEEDFMLSKQFPVRLATDPMRVVLTKRGQSWDDEIQKGKDEDEMNARLFSTDAISHKTKED